MVLRKVRENATLLSELGSRWPNKPSTEHSGRRLSAADKEPRSDMTLPMQIKTICSRSRKDQEKNFNKRFQGAERRSKWGNRPPLNDYWRAAARASP